MTDWEGLKKKRSVFVFKILIQTLLREDEMGRHLARMKRYEMHTKFWSENLKERDHAEDEKRLLDWI
jgi:hypothetical protein